jgi:hypothetical protein
MEPLKVEGRFFKSCLPCKFGYDSRCWKGSIAELAVAAASASIAAFRDSLYFPPARLLNLAVRPAAVPPSHPFPWSPENGPIDEARGCALRSHTFDDTRAKSERDPQASQPSVPRTERYLGHTGPIYDPPRILMSRPRPRYRSVGQATALRAAQSEHWWLETQMAREPSQLRPRGSRNTAKGLEERRRL